MPVASLDMGFWRTIREVPDWKTVTSEAHMHSTLSTICNVVLLLIATTNFAFAGYDPTQATAPDAMAPLGKSIEGKSSIDFGKMGIGQGIIAHGALTGPATAKALSNVKPDRQQRGGKEMYKKFAPSVVLIVTQDGLGSGFLANESGDIVTNWHVVKGYDKVAVIFKPSGSNSKLQKSDARLGVVAKVDEVRDLALIKVTDVPKDRAPLPLGSLSGLEIGSDVHAIGHPTGESWTYTKGVVSQIRQNYDGSSSQTGVKHNATVIQTQTPINPGNSGGPLFSNQGKLIGVNSFKASGEGLNFAVSVDDVKQFLAAKNSRSAEVSQAKHQKATSECKLNEVYRSNDKTDSMEIVGLDVDCDGKAEAELRTPYDIRKPIILVVDDNKDGVFDVMIADKDRDGYWDFSLRDTDFDKKWDLVCEHRTGEIEATKCEKYVP